MAGEVSTIPLTLMHMKNGSCVGEYRWNAPVYESPSLLRQGGEELKRFIESQVRGVIGTLPKLYFVDEEGEQVLLENVDSYVESIKDAKKTKRLVIVAKESKPDSMLPALGTMSPTWFITEMQKMKSELKEEILSALNTARVVNSAEPGLTRSTPKLKLPPKSESKSKAAKGDCIARALKLHGGLTDESGERSKQEQPTGGAKPKSIKGDYISRALKSNGGLLSEVERKKCQDEAHGRAKETTTTCGGCGREAGEPYFMCLDSECMVMICRDCETQHPTGHAMLRLPKQLDGRRFAASTARMILLSMKSSKQSRKKCEKKGKEEKALKKEEKVLKKAAKEAALKGKRLAECMTMEVVLNSAGIAVVTWMIVNTGKKIWDKDVKLVCLACSDSELKPVEWEVSVPFLEPGDDACVQVQLVAPKRAGEYKTFWMLTHKGKRFSDLSATILVPAAAESLKEQVPVTANMEVEHSYALKQTERPKDPSPMSETYEKIDRQESTSPVEEEGSLISGVTECKSAALEQEYDLIPGNCDSADVESMEEVDERDSSYVSIASPVIVDESPDSTSDLTEMWQRLSISLSSLAAPNSDAETCRIADVEVEVEAEADEKETDAELLEELENEDDSSTEALEKREEETVVLSPSDVSDSEEGAVTTEPEKLGTGQKDAALASEPVAIDGMAQSETNSRRSGSSEETHSMPTSRSNSFDSKRQQFSETVTNAISNALLTTTQTLATVGATAKEIHTMATAIVRTNFHGHSGGKESWQPPRAWVPKATQTTWTPAEDDDVKGLENMDAGYNPYARQLTQLSEMGFYDLGQNERLLRENHGNVDRVILILLDEKSRDVDAL